MAFLALYEIRKREIDSNLYLACVVPCLWHSLKVAKPSKITHIVILDRKWKVRFHTPSEYVKKVATDSKCEIDDELRTIDFDLQYLSHERAAHELGHCYAKERSLVETQLTQNQLEEFFCEIIGKHIKTINKQADILDRKGKAIKWRKLKTNS